MYYRAVYEHSFYAGKRSDETESWERKRLGGIGRGRRG